MRRSSRGERALIGGSIAVLLALFLPWLSTSCAGGCGGTDLGGSIDGVHGLGLVTLLGLLLVIGLWSVRSNPDRVRIPALPLTDPRIYMLCGALEVTGVVLCWLEYRSAASSFLTVTVHPSVGWFLALAGAVSTICGGLLFEGERSRS
jgi:hypothetical protein